MNILLNFQPQANTNQETGLPYGVIRGDALDPDVLNDLHNAASAVVHDTAIIAAKQSAEQEIRDALEVFGFRGPHIEEQITALVEDVASNTDEDFTGDEPTATIEHEGVRLHFGYLGGAILISSINGPRVWANRYCSPCVPGAADLDSGFTTDEGAGIECHGIPASWLRSDD